MTGKAETPDPGMAPARCGRCGRAGNVRDIVPVCRGCIGDMERGMGQALRDLDHTRAALLSRDDEVDQLRLRLAEKEVLAERLGERLVQAAQGQAEQVQVLSLQLKAAKGRVEELEVEAETLAPSGQKAALAKLRVELDRHREAVSLPGQEARRELVTRTDQLREARREAEAIRRELADAKVELSVAGVDAPALDAHVTTRLQEMADSRDQALLQVSSWQRVNAEANARTETMEAELATLREELDLPAGGPEAGDILEAIRSRTPKADPDLVKLREEATTFKGRLDFMAGQVEAAEARVRQAEAIAERHHEDRMALQRDRDGHGEEAGRLRVALDNAMASEAKAQARVKGLTGELSSMTYQVAETRRTMGWGEGRLHDLAQVVAAAEASQGKDLAVVRDRLRFQEETSNALREDLEGARAVQAQDQLQLRKAMEDLAESVHQDAVALMALAHEAKVNHLHEEMDRMEDQLRDATRICDKAGCVAAVIRRDSGSRVCAGGHESRWVDKADLEAAQEEAVQLRVDRDNAMIKLDAARGEGDQDALLNQADEAQARAITLLRGGLETAQAKLDLEVEAREGLALELTALDRVLQDGVLRESGAGVVLFRDKARPHEVVLQVLRDLQEWRDGLARTLAREVTAKAERCQVAQALGLDTDVKELATAASVMRQDRDTFRGLWDQAKVEAHEATARLEEMGANLQAAMEEMARSEGEAMKEMGRLQDEVAALEDSVRAGGDELAGAVADTRAAQLARDRAEAMVAAVREETATATEEVEALTADLRRVREERDQLQEVMAETTSDGEGFRTSLMKALRVTNSQRGTLVAAADYITKDRAKLQEEGEEAASYSRRVEAERDRSHKIQERLAADITRLREEKEVHQGQAQVAIHALTRVVIHGGTPEEALADCGCDQCQEATRRLHVHGYLTDRVGGQEGTGTPPGPKADVQEAEDQEPAWRPKGFKADFRFPASELGPLGEELVPADQRRPRVKDITPEQVTVAQAAPLIRFRGGLDHGEREEPRSRLEEEELELELEFEEAGRLTDSAVADAHEAEEADDDGAE